MLTTAIQINTAPDLGSVKQLVQYDGPAVSIYLTEHKAGSGSQPLAVRLHTALPGLEEDLRVTAAGPEDIAAIMDTVRLLAAQIAAQGSGVNLGAFIAPAAHHVFQLPWPIPDAFFAGSRFVVAPLIEHLTPRGSFHVLTITRKRARLLKCVNGHCEEVVLPASVPDSVEGFLAFDAPDHRLMNNSSGGPSTGSMSGVMFGVGRDRHNQYFHDYCLAVNRGLLRLLEEANTPLILAGATAEVSAYRSVNSYRDTLVESVLLSPDGGFSPAEIAARANELLHNWLSRQESHVIEVYERNVSLNRTSHDNAAIEAAAAGGRVRELFVAEGHCGAEANSAVSETLRHSGTVAVLPPDRMPEHAEMAALLRY